MDQLLSGIVIGCTLGAIIVMAMLRMSETI